MAYVRNVEDIFGDMSSSGLVRNYPKWTCFHVFVEELILSVVLEDIHQSGKKHGQYWVDHLLKSNGFDSSVVGRTERITNKDYDYLGALHEYDLIAPLCEKIAKQVFHVLFSNRGTMLAFGSMVRGYILETAPAFVPEAFNGSGHLCRGYVPTWARSAIFHRDKGRCVLCQTDLTRLVSQGVKAHYDHIIPLAYGGMNCVTNLQLTCSRCNLNKGARSLATSREYEAWYDY